MKSDEQIAQNLFTYHSSLVTFLMGTTGGIKVFSGNANPNLAEEIARHLGCDHVAGPDRACHGHAGSHQRSDRDLHLALGAGLRGPGRLEHPDTRAATMA